MGRTYRGRRGYESPRHAVAREPASVSLGEARPSDCVFLLKPPVNVYRAFGFDGLGVQSGQAIILRAAGARRTGRAAAASKLPP